MYVKIVADIQTMLFRTVSVRFDVPHFEVEILIACPPSFEECVLGTHVSLAWGVCGSGASTAAALMPANLVKEDQTLNSRNGEGDSSSHI